MKKNKAILLLFIIIISSSCMTKPNNAEINVTVQINYGTHRPMRDTVIKASNGVTALEALQYASNVETHAKGKYVFVTAIDSIRGSRGVMAWYYQVNQKPTGKLAINQPLHNGDVVTWIYKTDVCSATVDNNNKTDK